MEILIERPVRRDMGLEHHCLEEPSCMGEMPCRRTCLGHGLYRGVGIRQRLTEHFARLTSIVEERMKALRRKCRLEELRRLHCVVSRGFLH